MCVTLEIQKKWHTRHIDTAVHLVVVLCRCAVVLGGGIRHIFSTAHAQGWHKVLSHVIHDRCERAIHAFS